MCNGKVGVKEGCISIFKSMRDNKSLLKELYLADNQIDSACLSYIAETLTVNNTLTILDLSKNAITLPDGIGVFFL